MSERFYTILSSAPTYETIVDAITDFFCGSVKTVKPSIPGMWDVINADGSIIINVHVRTKRGRFLFVSTR